MSDFDDWVKKQSETPKTAAPKPTGGSFDSWVRGESKPQPAKPATVLPQDRQEFGRRPTTLDQSLNQSARVNREQPSMPALRSGPLYESMRSRRFEEKPVLEQWKERVRDAAARGGGGVSRMARQVTGAGLGVVQGLNSGNFTPVDLPEWRKGEEGRMRNLESRRLSRPTSFATETAEGIIESLPTAALATLGTMATGGSLPAAAAIGGGMSAAGADWKDPKRAAVQTALGAVAPIAGGKVGQSIGSAVASRLARPVAQGAARAGGELIGGGAGNVIGSGAEQLAFEGKLNPRELARQGVMGAALNVPGAVGAARRPVRSTGSIPAAQPVVAPEAAPVSPRVQPAVPQSAFGLNLPGMGQGMGDAIRRAWRDSVQSNGQLPRAEKGSLIDQIFEMAVRRGNPRNVATLDKAMQLFEQGPQAARQQFDQVFPARTTPPLPARSTAEIPQVPTTPTQRIQYPDAPATQEMPEIRARIAAENATTKELRPSNETVKSYKAPEPVTKRSELAPETPQTQQAQRVSGGDQSPPKATDENIDQLRARYEELGREAYDRRGDFTGDLRDEYNRLNSVIREYNNARAPRELAPPSSNQPERFTPPKEEIAARREALQPKTGPMPETLTPGRKVTRETQLPPGMKASEAFSSREDARQGHFEQFNDDELVQEIRRMEEIQNQAVGGRSKLTPEQLEANRFDLKTAVEMQKERLRQQTAIGVDPANRIAPRTPGRTFKKHPEGRQIQHSTLGLVTQAENQKGVPSGKLRVVGEDGGEHTIQNPRTRGNREATFIRSIPSEALPELQASGAPKAPKVGEGKDPSPISYAIPDEAMPEMRARKPRATVMGAGLGSLQPMFEGKGPDQPGLFGKEKPKNLSRKEIAETAGGVQTLSQLGNPRFVIRNVVQHVAFGKQERVATRLAAVLDWAISKGSGTPRQVYQPRGSDLRAYIQNWGKAIKAYKSGQPLPGKPNADYLTADANKLDKAVSKVMTWMNEIPDAANWQTRFESSLQTIMGGKKLRAPLDMDSVIDQATMEANRASLRDENFASVALQKIKQGLNKASSPIFGSDKFGAGDFILKYAQTPGALLKRGLERSPLGLFQVAKEAATPGPFRRRNTLLALSRVIEGGVAGAGLGAALAGAGVLVGPEEESKSGRAMEREEGKRGYSLNGSALIRLLMGESTEMQAGDQLYTIDWLQPWAMNLSAGAAVYGLHRDGKLGVGEGAKATGEAVYSSIAKTLDVMGDQSVLKNLSRYLDKGVGETFTDKFLNFMKAVGLDVPSSFVPSLARQARQVADPLERDTRPEKRGGFQAFMEEAGNRALSQLPGVSQTFPTRPSLLTGEDRKTSLGEMSPISRTLAQFSPANVSTFTPRPVAREISRLNRSGEKVSISFPAPKKGEATEGLRKRERQFAESFSKLSQEMIGDPLYKDSDNATKAAAFEGLKWHLRGLGKEEFEEKDISEIIEAAIETVEKRREKED